jgi:putative transposase
MFNHAIAGQQLLKHVGTDHDPPLRFHRWLANLRVLEIDEIKSVPNIPTLHPFVERLIGTIRHKYLDRAFFWNALDLRRELYAFGGYYHAFRVHRSLDGTSPAQRAGTTPPPPISLDHRAWRQHCGGLFQPPMAAWLQTRPQQATPLSIPRGTLGRLVASPSSACASAASLRRTSNY